VFFDSVGGLTKHIRALKEMIVFPLLYPEVFVRFKIAPPRGVLFHGPPGMPTTHVLSFSENNLNCFVTTSLIFLCLFLSGHDI